jgi:alpha-L-rhamnosidase
LVVAELRCEHHAEPLALDTRVPRFSWKLAALDESRRGLRQTAYRILVASSSAELASEHGDLWDSGRVDSRATVDIEYAGRALESFELAYWKARVWDQDGTPSAWSLPSRFGVGALSKSDWHARWIGYDAPLRSVRPVPDLGAARWIGSADEAREVALRARFEVAEIDANALVVLAAVDDYELYLNGTLAQRGGANPLVRRNAEIQKIAGKLVRGTNTLAVKVRTRGDSPAALCARIVLAPTKGDSEGHELQTDAAWRASTDPTSGWESPDFDDGAWTRAKELTPGEWLPEIDPPAVFLPPPRTLRTEFSTREKPARATLYASALGLYSIELNGTRAHEDWFAPGWTDYRKCIPYRAYDVSALVRAGPNALGVVLADGWYCGMLGQRGQRNHYGSRSRFLGQFVLEYADGTREFVTSDEHWRAHVGAWREADLYMGERYDARREERGWSEPGFDATRWDPVDVGPEPSAPLASHPGPRIGVVTELAPLSVVERGAGKALFDFGQNVAGVVRLALEAPAGTTLILRFGEELEEDGSLFRRNLTWARSVDQYVARGGGPETWQPRFTYHGFRYVEVSGFPGSARPDLLRALALSSATRDVGEFHCSDPRLERLVENARWTLRANSMDVPTDCPQRGERLGWTGDGQLFAASALWLADLQTLYDKWSIDLLGAQRPDGRFPLTAPAFPLMPVGGPFWEDAGVLVPALLHERTGDRRLAERHLESMRAFLASCAQRSGAELRAPATIEGFGDWNHFQAETPKDVLFLAAFARSARRYAELARALGRPTEEFGVPARFAAAFERACFEADGRVRGGTQTAYALALNENLVSPERRTRLGELLVADLAQRKGLTTGFVGTAELLPALSAIGRSDLAYGLLRSNTLPSWGYMLDQGATTIWERWDARTPSAFANQGRPSLSHTTLASFVAWLFENAAGIRPGAPGFSSLRLEPEPGPDLTWLEASHDSVRGRIRVRWERAGDEWRVAATVPPNLEATLTLRDADDVHESGRACAQSPGVRELGRLGKNLLLGLESGAYSFRFRSPR